MPGRYEYKVIPAPAKGKRAKGAKGAEGRFSHSLTVLMNEMAEDGWEFQRAECLPSLERVGLTKTEMQQHNLLVFRRLHPDFVAAPAPSVAAPAPAQPLAPTMAAPVPDLDLDLPETPKFSGTARPKPRALQEGDAAPAPAVADSPMPDDLRDGLKNLRER